MNGMTVDTHRTSTLSVTIRSRRPRTSAWSYGEVKKPETINYRTYRPEKDGLFCEKIFGPDPRLGVLLRQVQGHQAQGHRVRALRRASHALEVRRKRMGHINLAARSRTSWFFKAMPSRIGNLLDVKVSALDKVIYFQEYIVIDPVRLP
jgi:DNA-directed RNA polymerase subunit beta'